MSRATGSVLTVMNALQFSALQLPLSLTALGLYIRDTQCGPFAGHSQASPPQPFCTAPVVLAAVIVLVEVCARARPEIKICLFCRSHVLPLKMPYCCLAQHSLQTDAALPELARPSMPCCFTRDLLHDCYGLSQVWPGHVKNGDAMLQVVVFLMVLFITPDLQA